LDFIAITTYLIPVVSAEITKRKISVTINTGLWLCRRDAIELLGWKDFKELERILFPFY
jgi:hypothetical protein